MKNQYLLYRALLVLGLTIIAILLVLPSLVGVESWAPAFLRNTRVHLGLDLQGGMHLVLSVDVDKAVENSLEVNGEQLRHDLREAGVAVKKLEKNGATALEIGFDADSRDKVKSILEEQFPNFQLGESATENGVVTQEIKLSPAEVARIRESAVEQSLETIRNRIDQFGVSEPIIQRQGEKDIVVQLPGVQDAERAKELIGRTAVLEFKLVRDDANLQAYIDGSRPVPAGTQVLYQGKKDNLGHRRKGDALLVESRTLMTGDVVVDAKVRPGELPNSRVVLLSLNPRGGRIFEQITGQNVNRRLAIILDNTIYSAPVIRERIAGGSAQIEGDFSSDEARDLTIVLRSGALPAPVTVAEERTVGPSLGQDSIQQGIRSFVVGGALVIAFMLIYYRFAGLLADLALVWNVIFMIAALAAFGATLTLPGIAGIVLTLGMAVDANVLINERIREELRTGKPARASVAAGYEHALPSILDTHVTTFLSGLILFQFGSGPIKGFAVTLCVGLVSSLFTAVVGTRLGWDYMLLHRQQQTVSI